MANTFTTAMDVTKPAGTRSKLLGDDDIREFKVQFCERFDIDHRQPQSESGIDTVGFHRKVTLEENSGIPTRTDNTFILYSYLVGSYSELHSVHENAGSNQLSYLGKLWIKALAVESEAEGDIIYRGASTWGRLAKGTASQQLRMNAGATAPEWFTPSATFTAGMIMIWSGTIASIPSGWVLCDGNNSTPDLRARFVYGASDEATAGHASPGSTGGALTLSGNDSAVVGTTGAPSAAATEGTTNPTASSSTHTHSAMPPYYALAYIMKT